MSAFIVDDSTINQIVTYLHGKRQYSTGDLAALGIAETSDGFRELGHRMADLNADAVIARYGHDKSRPMLANYQHRYQIAKPVQVYKSLQCWLYQCCEGDIPDSTLYRWMSNTLLPKIALDVIERLPEYEAATWQ